MTNEEARAHMDMLIAHKDKALETHPYFKRCDNCIHSEEQDGSNCYECVKGMADNFKAQSTDADSSEFDSVINQTVKEWFDKRNQQQPSEDCLSRAEVKKNEKDNTEHIGKTYRDDM